MPPERDPRALPALAPYYALAALVALVVLAFALPATRGWVDEAVVTPLRAQAGEEVDLRTAYTVPSLAAWALVGGVLAWVAYDLVFVRARFEPDRDFFVALAPALLFGPLFHATLLAGVLAPGSLLAWLAAEPLVYLTAAALAGVGLALGRLSRRPLLAPLLWGALVLAPLLVASVAKFDRAGAAIAFWPLALAALSTFILAWIYVRARPGDTFLAVSLVVGAHALDGATTWMLLRPETFGLPSGGFGERNPVSETLVTLGNGWPYFAVKLALPLVLLAMVKREESEARLRAFLLFAVFVLGFGPGMSNLLQVVIG